MSTTDFQSQPQLAEAQEIASASSSYTMEPTNCQATIDQTSTPSKTKIAGPTKAQAEVDSQEQSALKVFAPLITHNIPLPDSNKEVPMVMVPVPETRTIVAIPLSTLERFNHAPMESLGHREDQNQARDLLVWNDGVGTLEGCDLRFKINQLGCLELLDSDDESENHDTMPKNNAISKNSNQSKNHDANKTTNGIVETALQVDRRPKKAKLDPESASIKHISPGSSLLKDGPNLRRPKSSTCSNLGLSPRSRVKANSQTLLKKLEQNQNLFVLEKLFPRQKIEEMKTSVVNWTSDDVKNFVDSIPGCSDYGKLFKAHDICGMVMLYLNQVELTDVLNIKLGPAVKICHAISLLK